MLIAKHICKSFGSRQVLRDVSLTVDAGELVVLTGPSGAGKSTVLRVLAMVDSPDEGYVELDGGAQFGSRGATGGVVWPTITMVFQQLFLWPHLSVRRNLTLALDATGDRDYRGRMDDLVDRLGMREYLDRVPMQVSIGERQRAAIARAVLLQPKYLLLDEVFSALDIEHVHRVLAVLTAMKSQGTGILLVTHLIGVARSMADRVVFLEAGTVIEEGTTAILRSPKTERLTEFLSLLQAVT